MFHYWAKVEEGDELRSIMDLFETMTEITISDVMSRFRLTRPTAGRKLNVLIKKGFRKKAKDGDRFPTFAPGPLPTLKALGMLLKSLISI